MRTSLCLPAVVLSVVSFVLAPNPTDADVINGSFEMGDFSQWATTVASGGAAFVVASHEGDSSTYGPTDGSYFAELMTDATISQTISVAVGDILTGWAAFDFRDYHPFNDNADVKIWQGATLLAVPWAEDGISRENYWDGPWRQWSWTSTVAGTIEVKFRVANTIDSAVDSFALFDGVAQESAGVPEPSTLLTFAGLGGMGLVMAWRRRKRTA